MRRFLIDTDTGSDDAVALILALKHPDVEVVALTTVAGNVPLAMATQNALYTLELCGSSVPVYEGLSKPLLRPLETAQFVHGEDGMGDIGLALHGRVPASGHAVDVILETFRDPQSDVQLITLGPLSNIAVALLRDPGLAARVSRCYIMGGTSDNFGNMSLAGEYNIWADPEAAQIVFDSGMAITMIGWDISRKHATFSAGDIARIKALDTPLAHFAVDIQAVLQDYAIRETGLEGFDLPDPIAVAIALEPRLITSKLLCHVSIETSDGQARGMTMLDYNHRLKRPANVEVVLSADREGFLELLQAALSA